jgi:hypothetical protein
MQPKTKWIAGRALVVAAIGGGTGVAVAASSGDDEEPLTGSTLDRAVDAALEETGGTVTETEAGDDGAAYSVEVRLDDGSQVEVNLDENFTVIGEDADDDGPNDDEAENDDDD